MDCDGARASTTLPIHEYSHADGISVTGGYVYRGSRILSRRGHYFFGDFSGRLWSFRFDGATVVDFQDWTGLAIPANSQLASFGENAAGDLFAIDLGGTVYRLASGDPSNSDIDNDGLNDADENILGTDQNDPDTDADGLSDGDEFNVHGSDPLLPDTDADGLTDGDEVNIHGTSPLLPDSDMDGTNDGAEIAAGTNPLIIPSAPLSPWIMFLAMAAILLATPLVRRTQRRWGREPNQ